MKILNRTAAALILVCGIGFEPGCTTARTCSERTGADSYSQPLQIDFNGSVAAGPATPGLRSISLREAIQLGLKYNLGVLVNRDVVDVAAAERGGL